MPYVGPAPTPNAPKDLQGGELKLDADADTSITADTDDTIHFKIAGADDFTFTANTFTAESGSTIAAQALTATTLTTTGATTAADITASGIIKTDDTTEATSTTDGSLQTDGGLSVVKDAVFGDDIKLISDSSVIHFGNDLDITLTHAADTGLTLNGTFDATVVTADGGLKADNITIDGTEIDLSSGDLTLDVAGSIILNADSGSINLVDDSTTFAELINSSSDFIVKSSVSDKDIIFKGVDGASLITALTLDMSEAGAAQFSGKVAVGAFAPSHPLDLRAAAGSTASQAMRVADASPTEYFGIFNANTGATAPNAANATCKVRGMATTERSINAGGTVNASGNDYAEYMTKANGVGTIEKGSICGVNSDGKLTNVFADAHSFVVKSTDPSYVGGDVWGIASTDGEGNETMLEGDELEAARQKVDRIAFSGQVPCLVTGTTKVGDYIIPKAKGDGSIEAVPVSDPTFEQYRMAVGRVWKLNSDTAKHIISVKVS